MLFKTVIYVQVVLGIFGCILNDERPSRRSLIEVKPLPAMCRMILKHQLMMEESVRKLSDLIRLPRWNRAERKPLSEQPIRGDTAPR